MSSHQSFYCNNEINTHYCITEINTHYCITEINTHYCITEINTHYCITELNTHYCITELNTHNTIILCWCLYGLGIRSPLSSMEDHCDHLVAAANRNARELNLLYINISLLHHQSICPGHPRVKYTYTKKIFLHQCNNNQCVILTVF